MSNQELAFDLPGNLEVVGADTKVMRGQRRTKIIIRLELALVDGFSFDNAHQRLIKSIAHSFGVTSTQVLGKSRKHHIARARRISMYLIREKLHKSFNQIAEIFQCNTSSVVKIVQKQKRLIEENEYERQGAQLLSDLVEEVIE